MKYLFDTDHVSLLQRKSSSESARLIKRLEMESLEEIGVSVITLHEQSLGCNRYISQAKSAAEVVRGYDMFSKLIEMFSTGNVVPFNSEAAKLFENLRGARVRIATMDLRLAATAKSRSLILLTRNRVDFERVPGLQIEDWTT